MFQSCYIAAVLVILNAASCCQELVDKIIDMNMSVICVNTGAVHVGCAILLLR